MNIYLIRHAQKDTSSKTTKEEHYHRLLTDIGISQAKKMAEYIEKYNITKIYSSDMTRAKTTAAEVAKRLRLPDFVKNVNLREADPCVIPNHPDRDKITIQCWQDWDYKPEHGESYNQAKTRFSDYFWNVIVKDNKDSENILIVSHGRVLRIFLSDYLLGGKDVIKTPYSHVAVSHLDVDRLGKKLKILIYNDNSFLPENIRL